MQIRKMTVADLDRVMEIEADSFSTPWSRESLEKDLKENIFSRYYVLEIEGVVEGFYGIWHVFDEGHLLNIAVSKKYRNQGYATKLLTHLIEKAEEEEVFHITLEVRPSNKAAIGLYQKFFFQEEGRVKNYYTLPKEDALILWRHVGDKSYERQYDTSN